MIAQIFISPTFSLSLTKSKSSYDEVSFHAALDMIFPGKVSLCRYLIKTAMPSAWNAFTQDSGEISEKEDEPLLVVPYQ